MEHFIPEDPSPGDSPDQHSGGMESGRRVRERAPEAAAPTWRAAKARLARVGDDVRIEMRSTAYAAERYAREKPWRVAAAAAGIALLAGCLLGAALSNSYWRRRLAR
jgi:ElaB/YqjD/DUF883 family membrane-anchored ribosome-binding protein